MKIYAHRGSSGKYPEMTLSAYEAAIEEGADGFECDVRLSKDKKIICIHDATTKRVGNRKIRVASSKVKEIKRVADVITLEELLQLAIASKRDILIETKHPTFTGGAIEGKVFEQLQEYDSQIRGAQIEVIVMSFSWMATRRFSNSYRVSKVSKFYLSAIMTRSKIAALDIKLIERKPKLVAKLQARGIRVFAWTVNSKRQLEICKLLKIDGVITDYPGRMARSV